MKKWLDRELKNDPTFAKSYQLYQDMWDTITPKMKEASKTDPLGLYVFGLSVAKICEAILREYTRMLHLDAKAVNVSMARADMIAELLIQEIVMGYQMK